MKKIIIIGSCFCKKDENYIYDQFYKSNICVANEQYESQIIDGCKENNSDFVFLSAPKAGAWPFDNKRLFIKGFSSDKYIKTVSYCSVYGLLNHFKTKALIKASKALLNNINKDDRIHVIACEAHLPYLKTLEYIKKHHSNSFSTLIVPDMPINMLKAKNPIYSILKKRNVESIQKICDKNVDSFLCFTSEINESINKLNKPSIIREGIITIHPVNKKVFSDEKHVVFLGKTNNKNGISTIIESARYLPKNIIIDIYGSGDMDKELKKISGGNILYHGFLQPNKVGMVLEKADMFLSPRRPEGEYVKYSFPSKVFEYLSYWKHVVTYKLPCYFSALDEILDYPKDYSAKSLAEKIIEVLNHPFDAKWHADVYDILQKYISKNVTFNLINLDNKND